MADKKSFVLYTNNAEQFSMLSDEQAGKLIKAIFTYSKTAVVPEFDDGMLAMAFSFIKCHMDQDSEKWEETRKKRVEAGRKGGKQTQLNVSSDKQTEANQANASFAKQSQANDFCDKQTEANQAVNVNDNVNVNVNVNDNVNNNIVINERVEEAENASTEASASTHNQKTKPKKHKYGEYGHVLLTDEQYRRLVEDYGNEVICEYVRKIDEWVQLKGKSPYKDYNLAVRKWLAKDSVKIRGETNDADYNGYGKIL